MKLDISYFREFLMADWKSLLLAAVYTVITVVLAILFKSDTFDLLAYQSFSVHDTSLSYSHVPSVVSGNLNIVLTTIYSLCIVVICSIFRGNGNKQIFPARLIWSLLILILAIIETNMITNFTKTRMGVLKPHFLTECNVQESLVPADGWIDQNLTLTICQNTEDIDYRRSFPSGHASQAGVGVAFAVIELEMMECCRISARIIQLLGVMYAITIFALRITNHQHHWPDVLVGAILGIVVAVTCYKIKEELILRYERKDINRAKSEERELADTKVSHA